MKLFAVLSMSLILILSACTNTKREVQYAKKFDITKPFSFKPGKLPVGGDTSGHSCLQGSYSHVYETGSEVWLCCIPPEEILRDSFNCSGFIFDNPQLASVFGGTNYAKIKYCSLLHPTATEPTYIPVCIEAPLSVDVNKYTK